MPYYLKAKNPSSSPSSYAMSNSSCGASSNLGMRHNLGMKHHLGMRHNFKMDNIFSGMNLLYSIGIPVVLALLIGGLLYWKKPNFVTKTDSNGNKKICWLKLSSVVIGILCVCILASYGIMTQL